MLLFGLLFAAFAAITAGVVMSQKAGTVDLFAPTKPSAADTVAVATDTVFPDEGWSVVTLNRLSEVEELLDCLEAHHVAEREVRVMDNNSFRVRWK